MFSKILVLVVAALAAQVRGGAVSYISGGLNLGGLGGLGLRNDLGAISLGGLGGGLALDGGLGGIGLGGIGLGSVGLGGIGLGGIGLGGVKLARVQPISVAPIATKLSVLPSISYGAAPIASIAAPSYGVAKAVDYYTVPKYDYKYAVGDPHTGDQKQQSEERVGDVVRGEYSLAEPDGTIRVVKYTADKVNGFNAQVSRIGKAIHPQKSYVTSNLGYGGGLGLGLGLKGLY